MLLMHSNVLCMVISNNNTIQWSESIEKSFCLQLAMAPPQKLIINSNSQINSVRKHKMLGNNNNMYMYNVFFSKNSPNQMRLSFVREAFPLNTITANVTSFHFHSTSAYFRFVLSIFKQINRFELREVCERAFAVVLRLINLII